VVRVAYPASLDLSASKMRLDLHRRGGVGESICHGLSESQSNETSCGM
jgi:hypothetical protein